jgi:ABC-type transport system involved in multi-copper enzyme maturation permease subunit
MRKIKALALNTFRELIRNRILYSVLFFAALMIAISTLFSSVTIGDHQKTVKDFSLFALSFFSAILTIVCGVDLLNKELKQKTICNILSKPVTRFEFIVGKFLGLVGTVWVLLAVMTLAVASFLFLLEGKIDWLIFQVALYVALEIFILSAVTIFFSTVVVTTALTGMFTFATYIAGRSIEYLKYFQGSDRNDATVLIVQVLDAILPNLNHFNIVNNAVYGEVASFDHLLFALCYAFFYGVSLLTLAVVIFARREFK